MAYITIDSITSRIPSDTLLEALDDDNDGVIDEGLWEAIAADASNAVDSILGQRFSTPFASPFPAIVVDAARVFALELLYLRRGLHTAEKNPWLNRANNLRDKLTRIASSDEPLTPNKKGKGRVKIISEPSRTTSSHGNLST